MILSLRAPLQFLSLLNALAAGLVSKVEGLSCLIKVNSVRGSRAKVHSLLFREEKSQNDT